MSETDSALQAAEVVGTQDTNRLFGEEPVAATPISYQGLEAQTRVDIPGFGALDFGAFLPETSTFEGGSSSSDVPLDMQWFDRYTSTTVTNEADQSNRWVFQPSSPTSVGLPLSPLEGLFPSTDYQRSEDDGPSGTYEKVSHSIKAESKMIGC